MLQGNINPIVDQANPADFIHLFTECPEHLEEFLEYLLQVCTLIIVILSLPWTLYAYEVFKEVAGINSMVIY